MTSSNYVDGKSAGRSGLVWCGVAAKIRKSVVLMQVRGIFPRCGARGVRQKGEGNLLPPVVS